MTQERPPSLGRGRLDSPFIEGPFIGFSTPILKYVGNEDANNVLREVHEGICGNHIRARSLVAKTLRQGYYWHTMLKDATELVKKM